MILNIHGNSSPYLVNRIQFNQFRTYSIRLVLFRGVISSYVPGGIYKLCSNVIDREVGNSERILTYIRLNRKSHTVDFTPTQSVWYKLRLLDFSSLELNLQSIASDEKIIFSEFCCQFEIQENERIQQFYSKP